MWLEDILLGWNQMFGNMSCFMACFRCFVLGEWGKKILVMMDGTRQRRVVGSFDVASLICNGLGGLVPRLSQVRWHISSTYAAHINMCNYIYTPHKYYMYVYYFLYIIYLYIYMYSFIHSFICTWECLCIPLLLSDLGDLAGPFLSLGSLGSQVGEHWNQLGPSLGAGSGTAEDQGWLGWVVQLYMSYELL